jgi:riboflavin kinase/FMN adenylyltransferase
MRVFRRFRELPPALRGASVAIGNFDGLHRGHVAVLEAAAEAARRLGGPLGVVTFEPHPREILQPESTFRRLTMFRTRADRLRRQGVDLCVALPFGPALMRLSPEAFAREILAELLGVRSVAAGSNFRFGHKRSGDLAVLEGLGRSLGFEVQAVPPLMVDGVVCSSTVIRERLAAGDVEGAARLLGHPFEFDGIVRPGDGRGRTIGFPTANVHPLGARPLLPGIGVYAVRAGLRGETAIEWHPAVANLGRRPTFDGQGVLLEVHLLDGEHDLYGRRMRVAFLERLRGEQRFPGIAELREQIGRDCAAARKIHGAPLP